MRIIFFDIEIYPNYFLMVSYDPYKKTYKTFEIFNDTEINQYTQLKEYLKQEQQSYFCGYNSLFYDMNILTEMITLNYTSNSEIKTLNDDIINDIWPKNPEWKLCNKTLDLMLINNYGPKSAKSTSLKKLEFNLRKKKIQDLPYHFNDLINTELQREEIIKYCKYDVEMLLDVFEFSKDLIKMRIEFDKLYNLGVLNSPEPDLAKKYVYSELAKSMNTPVKEFKDLRTYHDEIELKDLILPFIKFENPIYQEVLDFYNSITLVATTKSTRNPVLKVINIKNAINKSIEYKELTTDYGAGGIHGCVKPGVYSENDNYMITTADFTSYYPHLQFIHNCVAQHIPYKVYSELVQNLFGKRKEYPKGTILNYSFKILINLLYGLSNSEYSALYDVRATLKTTINGMLILSMIAERLYNIDNLKVLMKNTDGLEIYHDRKDKEKVHFILEEISELVNIPIEIDEYSKMIIRDVNNYISVTTSGKVKTKGIFEDYDDIIKAGAYHKDTSAMIIPKALKAYYIEDIPVEKTINNENSIYEFCYGNKSSKDFTWMLTTYDENKKVSTSKLFNSRYIRYFAGGLNTISQFWVSGKRKGVIQAVQAQTPITMLMNVPKEDIYDYNRKGERVYRYNKGGEIIERYPTLNKQWYIDKCYEIIKLIN